MSEVGEVIISDERMDELIRRVKATATISTGGGNGGSSREAFYPEVYKATLDRLIANERVESQGT